jgi:type II secretion system protein I
MRQKSFMLQTKNQGFSLIEVIVATAITAIIATSLIFLFTQSISTNRETKEKQIASQITQSRIEELRNMPFSEMVNASEDISISDLPSGRRITKIKNPYLSNDIKEAEVEITWTSGPQTKSIKINTLIYNE